MRVLDVRPGITDPASIKFRNENELMEKAEDAGVLLYSCYYAGEDKTLFGVCTERLRLV